MGEEEEEEEGLQAGSLPLPAAANRLGQVGYWAAAVVVVILGIAWWEFSQRTQAAAAVIDRAFAVLEAVATSSGYLGRSESANRGFHLYGRDSFLADRDAAIAQAESALEQLLQLTDGNAVQRGRAQELAELFRKRVALMRSSDPTPAGAPELTGRMYELAGGIRAEELHTVRARRQELEEQDRFSAWLLLGSVAGVLAVMLPGYLGFRSEARQRWRAQRQLMDLAESLPGAVFQYRRRRDGTESYEFVTTAAEAVRGIPRERILADSSLTFRSVVSEDLPRFRSAIERAERDLTPIEVDYRVSGPDGKVRWIRTSAVPRKSSDGVLFSGLWNDVTDKVQMEGELRHSKDAAEAATRAKSAFLATMSHEIRTPMNGILGMLELVLLTPLNPEQRTALEVMAESGRSLLRIIDDILDFSKVEAGKLELIPEPAYLRSLLDRLRNVYSGNASSKGLLLKLDVDPRLRPAYIVDPVRLQQVLGNLVSNAIKFSSEGQVVVSARLVERGAERDHVEFTVTDEGRGVSPEDLERLFEPFSQVGSKQGGRLGGTGLGLSICRRLVEKMGGEITMESRVGDGTTVCFSLWLEAVDPARVHEAVEERRGAASGGLSLRAPPAIEDARRDGRLVLIVDDHPVNRMVLVRQVNFLGYAAVLAEDGEEAVECWARGGIGLVLTDCHMPIMDGYELARRIRAAETSNGGKHVPIIACTANALSGEAEKCFAAGMDGYLAKPVDLQSLGAKLAAWLGEPPEAEAAADDVPIDTATLVEMAGDDPAAGRELVRRFHEYNAVDASAGRAAFEARDAKAMAQAFHRMKGAARTVGAIDLGTVCERIERASRAEDWAAAAHEMPALVRELARLDSYVNALK